MNDQAQVLDDRGSLDFRTSFLKTRLIGLFIPEVGRAGDTPEDRVAVIWGSRSSGSGTTKNPFHEDPDDDRAYGPRAVLCARRHLL